MVFVTHQAVLVGNVVGELEFVKGDELLHPLFSGGRGIRVDVHSFRHLGVGFAGDDPPTVVELVPVVV